MDGVGVMDEAAEFRAPDFTADLDVEGAIARCLPEATAKGMFLSACVELGRRAAPTRAEEIFTGVSARRWAPFLDYSLRDEMRLLVNSTRLRWPSEPVRERLRRMGWTAYPTFSESMAGRVILGMVSKDIASKFGLISKAFALSVSHLRISPRRIDDRHWQMDYEQTYCFLDSYHVGIIEGFVRAHGLVPDVKVRMKTEDSGTFDVRW